VLLLDLNVISPSRQGTIEMAYNVN
jgi:hypothetical protein